MTSGGEDEIVTLDVLDTVRVFSTRTRAKEASLKAGLPAAAVTSVLCVPAGGGGRSSDTLCAWRRQCCCWGERTGALMSTRGRPRAVLACTL